MANKRITDVDYLESLNSDESFFVNQNNSIKQISKSNIVFDIANGGTGASNANTALQNLGGYSSNGGTINGNVNITGELILDRELILNSPLPIEYGGTGAVNKTELTSEVFGATFSSISTYPEKAGIYRLIGAEIFSNLKAPHGVYGVLVIFEATYAMHVYIDNYGKLFWGRSGNTFKEPDAWYGQDILNSETYGTSLPSAGVPGRIFYKKVQS